MGSVTHAEEERPSDLLTSKRADEPPVVRAVPADTGGRTVEAHRGEIVGFAGLAGHGQTEMLLRLYQAAGSTRGDTIVDGPVALVAGDRQNEGIFPLWSIARNIGTRSIASMTRGGLVDPAAERRMADDWRERIGIRTPDVDQNILSLSGGNQQKVLFARALGSDAEVVLMDDPMRGVDVGTRREVYRLLRDEAARGRVFVWYTTEMDELSHCNHVYVFRNGRVVAELTRSELTEAKVLQSSFEEGAA